MANERLTQDEEIDLVREKTSDGSPVTSNLRIESFGVRAEVSLATEDNEEPFIPTH